MKLFIGNMVCARCKMVVRNELEKLALKCRTLELGEVDIIGTISDAQRTQLKTRLASYGLELIEDKKSVLIGRIKNVIVELVHHCDERLKTNFSVFLSKKLGYDYTYLANVFSDVEGVTIGRFLMLHRIERAKELIGYNQLNLTEIAFKLHYSSVAHLSNQFKKMTGLTTSNFKKLKGKKRYGLENV